MSSSRSSIFSSSSRSPRDLEDALIFSEDLKPVKDWYNRQSSDGSTTVKMMQLRNEYVVPFHQFIVVQTQGELTCAYRVDRGREKEGWSVFDTIKKLGVPPRDTIALLQQPLEELDKTSHCAKKLYCSDDKNIDLSFVLAICFRIHNNWGTRYNLITHNCYFFARTIIGTCDDKLDKESSRLQSVWRRILETFYRRLALLLWVVVWALVLVLRMFHFEDRLGFSLGVVLGVVNMLLMLLVLLQVHVALAVRAVVDKAVQWERELELEQGGVQELELEELERNRVLEMMRERKDEQARARVWVRVGRRVLAVLKTVLIMTVTQVLPLALALLLLLLPLGFGHSLTFEAGFLLGGVGIVILSPLLVWLVLFFRWCSAWSRAVRTSRGRPSDSYAEEGGILAAGAVAEQEQEQELGVDLAETGRLAHWGNGWAAVATEEDQAEAGSVTGRIGG